MVMSRRKRYVCTYVGTKEESPAIPWLNLGLSLAEGPAAISWPLQSVGVVPPPHANADAIN